MLTCQKNRTHVEGTGTSSLHWNPFVNQSQYLRCIFLCVSYLMDKWFCAISVNCLSYLAGVCDVWGGQHHLTFDGKTYNFTKNCTYYLVKEIITKYNLTITVNHVCDSSDSIPCSQIFTVMYGSTTVVFKQLESSPTPVYAVRNYSDFSNIRRDCISAIFSNF